MLSNLQGRGRASPPPPTSLLLRLRKPKKTESEYIVSLLMIRLLVGLTDERALALRSGEDEAWDLYLIDGIVVGNGTESALKWFFLGDEGELFRLCTY